jgi:Tol biopolymer transport system component
VAAGPLLTGPGPDAEPLVKLFDGNVEIGGFLAFDPTFTGGVHLAVGDVTGDGVPDLVVGAGEGGLVKVFDGVTGFLVWSFPAYDAGYDGAVRVAVGDVTGDGRADIITGTGPGHPPLVRVFDFLNVLPVMSFNAYDPGFTGGVFVAAGDIDADGHADIITGMGNGGWPQVKVFDGATGLEVMRFLAFGRGFHGGVRVAAGDLNADGKADIIVGAGPGGLPQVKVYDGPTGVELRSFLAYDPGFTGGVYVAAGDINGDTRADIITGMGPGGWPQVKVFDGVTGDEILRFLAYGRSYHGGVRVAALAETGPAFTSATSTTFTVGVAGNFDVTTVGTPPAALTYSGALPTGVGFTDHGDGTGTLSGMPAAGTGGTYPIVFTADNGVGTPVDQSFTLTVNEAPTITSLDHVTFTVGTAGAFSVAATGFPPPTFQITGGLPGGVNFDTTTGALAGTPNPGTGGTYPLSFTATNAAGASAPQSFLLTVNQLPVITSPNATTFPVSTPGSFTVAATGFPAPTFLISGTLPPLVTFDTSTGLLSGIPNAGTAGSYPLTFTATNAAGSSAPQSFTLTVSQGPVITSPDNITFTVGTFGSFTVTADGFTPPTFSILGGLPGGVAFNTTTGVLSGTPDPGTGGTYPLTFTAMNAFGSSAPQSFTLTVNEAPTITSDNATTFTVGVAGSFTVAATGFPAPTFAIIGSLPPVVTFGTATGLLSGTPDLGTGGSYPLTFTATNAAGSSAPQSFTLTVSEGLSFTSANATTFTAGVFNSFSVETDGFPYPTLTRAGAPLPSALTFVDNGNGTGTLGGTPAAGGTQFLTQLTHTTGGLSGAPSVSGDGSRIAFVSDRDLTPGSPGNIDGNAELFLYDTTTGAFTQLTNTTGGATSAPVINAAGTRIAFVSDRDLTGGNADGNAEVFLYDLTTSTFTQITSTTGAVNAHPTINAAGTRIAFVSDADLTPGSPGNPDANDEIFLYDTTTSTFTQLTDTTGGVNEHPAIDAAGFRIAFVSDRDLTGGNAELNREIFLVDTFASTLSQITDTPSGVNEQPAIDRAGNRIAFVSDRDGNREIFLVDIALGTTTQVTTTTGGVNEHPAIDGAGTRIAFVSDRDLTGGNADGNTEVFLHDTVAATFVQLTTTAGATAGPPAVNTAGSRIAFATDGNPTGLNADGNPELHLTSDGAGGTYVLRFTASNGVSPDAVQDPFTLTVAQAPAITSADAVTFTIGQFGSFTVGATGFPPPSFLLSGTPLPGGVSFFDNGDGTATLSGTPPSGSANTYPLIITAGNLVSPDAVQSFTLTVGKQAQTISFTSTAPTDATVGGPTYTVTATATSGLPVTFTIDGSASSVCSIAGAVVSFTGAGTCVINANQAGNADYAAAPQVQQSFPVVKGSQTISFTSTAPGGAVVGGPTYLVTATATSGLTVTFTIDASASTVCSVAGSTVSFIGAGTCVINADQAGDASYDPAPQVQQSFAVGKGSQTISFTSLPPAQPTVGGATYMVTATATSGLPVTLTIDPSALTVCSLSGSTSGSAVSFGPSAGTCVINANQAGNANYNPAPQVQQSFAVKNSQTITFTSPAPTNAVVGGPTYLVTATATSGLTVTFTIDASASTVCSIAGSTVSFIGAGTCVINANQAGNVSFHPAPQVQQSFIVKQPQTITFTSTAPNPAIYLGPTYIVTATATSGLAVTLTIDPSASTVCSLSGSTSGSTVSFIGTGVCVINANQGGNGTFAPAPQVQQSFAVVPNAVGDAYNALGNVLVDSATGTPFKVTDNDIFPAGTTISAFDAASVNGGTVSMVSSGANMGQFTYNPPVGFPGPAQPDPGTDTFTYTLSSNGQTRQATVTFTIPRKKVWFVNNNAGACPAAPCNGRLTNPFVDTSNFQTANALGTLGNPLDNDAVFVYSSLSNYSGAIILRNGERLVGQHATGTLSSLGTVTAQNGQTLPATNNATPATLTSSGSVVTVGTGNFIHGLTLGNVGGAGSALTGTGFGTLTVNDNLLINTNGRAINLTNGTFNATLTSVTSTAGTNNVNLNTINGTVTLGSGALSGAAGDAFLVDTGTANITYTGTIASGSAHSVNVTNKTGGSTVTLSGGVTDTDTGISLTNNGGSGGATITFQGGLSASTGGSPAFTATGGGTVNVCDKNPCGAGGAVVNTLTTTTGTALTVTSTNIGTNGLRFRSITANGSSANAGIVLNTTGSSGSLTVTGTGGAGTGGTISNKTGGDILNGTNGTGQSTSGTNGTGIFLKSTSGPSFNNMQLNDFTNFAIYGNNVTGFSLTNSTISGTNGNNNAGDRQEGSVRFDNLFTSASFPTAQITGSNISGGAYFNVWVLNTTSSTTLDRLMLTGNTFGLVNATTGNDNVTVLAQPSPASNNPTVKVTVQDNFFLGTKGDFFEAIGDGNSIMDVLVKQNKFTSGQAITPGGGTGVSIRGDAAGTADSMTFEVSCNRVVGAVAPNQANAYDTVAVFIAKGNGNGTWSGSIYSNAIGPAKSSPSAANADAIFVRSAGAGTISTLIQLNTMTGYGNAGIHLQNNDGSATMNATIFGNLQSLPNAQNFAGIFADNGATGGDTSTMNVVIGSALVAGNQNTIDGIGIDASLSNFNASTTFNLFRNGSAGGTATAVVQDDNVGSPTVDTTGGSGPITLVTPGLPPAPAPPAACTIPP